VVSVWKELKKSLNLFTAKDNLNKMKIVYTDNNATTKTDDKVIQEMLPYFGELYGNPSSMHTFGDKVAKKLIQARQKVADLINADPEEIIFTSCGTESDNAAIASAINAFS